EQAPRRLLQTPRSVAAGALERCRPGLDTVAAARRTRDGNVEGDADLHPARRIGELDLDGCANVCAATAGRLPEQLVAEEDGEDVAESAEVEMRRLEPAGA